MSASVLEIVHQHLGGHRLRVRYGTERSLSEMLRRFIISALSAHRWYGNFHRNAFGDAVKVPSGKAIVPYLSSTIPINPSAYSLA
jgi:hypothetical protein